MTKTTFKYWDGSQWVKCSAEEADKRKAAGQRILERGGPAKPAAPAKPLEPKPPGK